MSDLDASAPHTPKPSRLSGLVAPKGAATRPSETPQVVPAAALQPDPVSAPAPAAAPAGSGSKSLTLRLPDVEYERLRSHAFMTRKTHQTILAEALRQYLDAASSK